MRMRTSTLSLLFFLLLTGAGWSKPTQPRLEEALDRVIETALDERRLTGCVVLVAHRGETIYAEAAGLADQKSGRPMRTDALFRLASVSKPMVTAAAMRLVEQGKLSLEDPVTRWLPDFRPSFEGKSAVITIRQLLNHTSGLSYRFSEPKESLYHALGVSDGLDNPTLTLAENLQRLSQAPLRHQPGTKFLYSLSIDVVGAVIEKVSGKPLPAAVAELVLMPLKMNDTGFQAVDAQRLTTAYGSTPAGPVEMVDGTTLALGEGWVSYAPSKALSAPANPSGGGGMVGSASDFLTFLEAIRRNDGSLLKTTTIDLMRQNSLGEAAGHRPGWGFGLGWAVLLDPTIANTPQSAGTLQWGGAYGHSWFIDPARELTVVIFTNTAFEGMVGKLPSDVRRAVYQWLSAPVTN